MDRKILHRFEYKSCNLCGNSGINEYFEVNSNFIEFNDVFHSLHEILNDVLNFKIPDKSLFEICLDCKDKVIKFYNFKRIVFETQKNIATFKKDNKSTNKSMPQNKHMKNKYNKIVKNICQIVQNYTEKCSIVNIKVNENYKILTIESNEEAVVQKEAEPKDDVIQNDLRTSIVVKEEPESVTSIDSNALGLKYNGHQSNCESTNLLDFSNVITIKQEPQDFQEITFENYTEKYNDQSNHIMTTQKLSNTSDQKRSISKAALKMRRYRERLKLPENKEKFLEHKERQKYWNRRHYLRKHKNSNNLTCS